MCTRQVNLQADFVGPVAAWALLSFQGVPRRAETLKFICETSRVRRIAFSAVGLVCTEPVGGCGLFGPRSIAAAPGVGASEPELRSEPVELQRKRPAVVPALSVSI